MRLATIACCVLPTIVLGCTSAPSVEVVHASAVRTIEARTEWALVLRVHNPNAAPLVLDRWTINTSGDPGYHVEWVASRTVPPLETIQEELPVVVSSGEVDWSVHGEAHYIATGRWADILFDTGFSRPSVGFSATPKKLAAGADPVPTAVDETTGR